jgi:hypothetical protein
MTLHETTILIKKIGIRAGIGIGIIIVFVIFIRVGFAVKDILFPPVMAPPTEKFGSLPSYQFPSGQAGTNFTYTLQTTTGDLPTTLSDGKTPIPNRLSVFSIINSPPNFLNLDKVKNKVASLEITSPEIQLANPYYEWDEPGGFNRKIIFDINSFDFKMTSDYLSSLTVLSSKNISDEKSAISTAQDFLTSVELMPKDLDIKKTEDKNYPAHYVTYPQLFSIQNNGQVNTLVSTTSLSKAQAIRVDFYQKDLEYDLDMGGEKYNIPKVHVSFPILYPHPPYSLMSFWVASGPRHAMVTQAFFTHKDIDLSDASATYPIKTPKQAFKELTDGDAYIASYDGSNNNILIKAVYLAYYMGEGSQEYIMPMYVFEGNNGFFGYVPAI